jgi:hypothetical protein
MLLGHTRETDAAGDGDDRGCDDAPPGPRCREHEPASPDPGDVDEHRSAIPATVEAGSV